MKRVLKGLAWVVGAVLLLVLLGAGVGTMLPVEHAATVSGPVAGSPERVWDAVTNVERFAAWRPDVDTAVRLPSSGLPRWREEGPGGAITFEVIELEPPSRMVTRIEDEGLPFGGTWTYELEPVPEGTRVTLTEDGRIYNPMFRFVARFFLGYDATMVGYLDALRAHMAG